MATLNKICLNGTEYNVGTDTKNTAGSTNTSSKIFLIGATSQAANPQTYSHDTAYVGTDGCLYSGGTKVLTAHQDISGKVSKSGDTMTGKLTFEKAFNQLITGTGTAASDKGSGVSPRYFPAKWTFNVGANAANGDIFTIKIPVAGHDYGVFVSVNNGTNYYPVALNGQLRLTTHFPVSTYLMLIFESAGSVKDVFALAGGDARVTVTGGAFRVINYRDTNDNTDIRPSAYCDTAAATAAKVASCTQYSLLNKSYLHFLMRYSNTAQSALTLNVNGKGAKPIYINGSASSASNYTLPAGTYIVYYNGTNYYFRTDGKLTADITGNAATVGGHSVAKDVPSDAKFTDTTYSAVSKTANGLCPQLPNETTTTKYLRQDGTWQVPPDTKVTVDTAMSTSSTNPVQNKVVNTAISTAETNAKNLANATGTLGIGNGGTGGTTAAAAEYNIIGGVETVDTSFDNNRYIAVRNQTVSSSNGSFRWFKVTKLWDYLKAKITGAISGLITSNLTASKALTSDANGKIVASSVTSTELGYLSGVTSAIQTQISNKANSASPTFTGTPAAPTAASGTSSTQIATTEFVNNATAEFFAKTIGKNILLSGGELRTNSGGKYYRTSGYVMLESGEKIPVMYLASNSQDIDLYCDETRTDDFKYVWADAAAATGYTKLLDYDDLVSAEGGGGIITIDDAMSSTSTNPVQNKVVKSAIGGAVAPLTSAVGGLTDRVTALESKIHRIAYSASNINGSTFSGKAILNFQCTARSTMHVYHFMYAVQAGNNLMVYGYETYDGTPNEKTILGSSNTLQSVVGNGCTFSTVFIVYTD